MSKLDNLVNDAMITMIVEFPTLAFIVSRIGVNVVNKPQVPAAAYTDGSGIYINEYAINKMNEMKQDTGRNGKVYDVTINKQKLIFIIAHELMHLLNNTYSRGESIGVYSDDFSAMGKAKNELWNLATDYEINSLLYHNTVTDIYGKESSRSVGTMPDWVCYDVEYRNMPAEQIYAELQDKLQQNDSGGMSLESGGMQFTFDGDNDNNQSGDGQNDPTSGDNDQNNNGQGKQSNGLEFGLDVHMPYVDEQTKEEVAAKIGDILGNGKQQGTGMSAFDRALEIFFKPQPFNWRRALTRYIKSFMKDNYTWNKPSRAGIANSLILPSPHKTPKLHVAIAVDTSGSIGNVELELLLNHVFTILSQFKQFQVDVWCCSTHVHPDTFRTYTASNKNELSKFKMESDGGTNMSANLPFIEKKYAKKMPDVVMIFTDGEDNLSGDTTTRTKFPIVWLIVDNKNFVKPKLIPGAVYEFNTAC